MSQQLLYIGVSQYLVRQGILVLLNEQRLFGDVEMFESFTSLKSAIKQKKPGLVILDYLNENTNFPEELKTLQIKSQKIDVLVIADDNDSMRIKKILKLGVKGFLTKSCSKAEIVEAINAIQVGESFFCNRVMKALVEDSTDLYDLSEREKEVVRLIANGRMSSEIAEELVISIHTVNSHRKNILKKLNLKSPTELIIFAAEQGWVSLDRNNG